jgi:hypothetical protein
MISYGERMPLSVSDLSLAPVEEKAEAFSTFFAHAGRYTLMEDKVIHHVEISSLQNWVDTNLVRLIKFQGDRIIRLHHRHRITEKSKPGNCFGSGRPPTPERACIAWSRNARWQSLKGLAGTTSKKHLQRQASQRGR